MRSPGAYEEPPGEERMEVDGVVYKKGDKVRLQPSGDGSDISDSLMRGKIATIETIYMDYEDHVHLAVTVDDDPGQDLMQDLGRYTYYKPHEVELIDER